MRSRNCTKSANRARERRHCSLEGRADSSARPTYQASAAKPSAARFRPLQAVVGAAVREPRWVGSQWLPRMPAIRFRSNVQLGSAGLKRQMIVGLFPEYEVTDGNSRARKRNTTKPPSLSHGSASFAGTLVTS